jgi:hypothetical protein
LDTFTDLIQLVEGLELDQLEPLTILLVWTWNSLYRFIVAEGAQVLVQGGTFFPEPVWARVDGASTGGRLLKTGWIGVGLLMEFRVSGKRVVTTPVVAIATERPGISFAQ